MQTNQNLNRIPVLIYAVSLTKTRGKNQRPELDFKTKANLQNLGIHLCVSAGKIVYAAERSYPAVTRIEKANFSTEKTILTSTSGKKKVMYPNDNWNK